jgi:hypothetical protein
MPSRMTSKGLKESTDSLVLSADETTSADENQAPSPVADALAFKDIRVADVEKAGSTEALLEPRTEMVKEKRKAMPRYCLSPHISVI